MNIIGNVEGKTCILIDDMIDTAGTICHAADTLAEAGQLMSVPHVLTLYCQVQHLIIFKNLLLRSLSYWTRFIFQKERFDW